MSTLINFYMAAPNNKYIMVFLFWLFWPGTMFIVGIIGESRLVPIVRSQSRAFLPGDLAFGVIFVSLIGLYQPGEQLNNKLFAFLLVPTLIIAWQVRENDDKSYPPRARTSPTKITHDFIGYFVLPIVLLSLGLPKLGDFVIHKRSFSDTYPHWTIVVSGLLFYIICVIIDNERPVTNKMVNARHPADWKPIWKKR